VAIKVADLSHVAAEISVHKRYVMGLEEELFRQGDREKMLGLPVSALCDRAKAGVLKSQVGEGAPLISILDDATTSLDSTTEILIQESLKYLMQSETVFVIANGLSTLLNMDKSLVFELKKPPKVYTAVYFEYYRL
jgi:hypothetical protein